MSPTSARSVPAGIPESLFQPASDFIAVIDLDEYDIHLLACALRPAPRTAAVGIRDHAQQHEAKITFAGNKFFSLESSVFKNKTIVKLRFIYFPLLVIIATLW
jgi:hypothetical protein